MAVPEESGTWNLRLGDFGLAVPCSGDLQGIEVGFGHRGGTVEECPEGPRVVELLVHEIP